MLRPGGHFGERCLRDRYLCKTTPILLVHVARDVVGLQIYKMINLGSNVIV